MAAYPTFAWLSLALNAFTAATASLPPPTGKWVLNYGATFCTLSRDGTDAEPGVAFRTRPFADDHELLVMLPPTGSRRFNALGTVFAGDLPAGPERSVSATIARKSNLKAVETTIRSTELTAALTTGKLRLVVPGKIDASLRLPAFTKAAVALRFCENDLAQRWKVKRTWTIDPQPTADPRSVFKADDYPLDMADAGKTGAARALLAIDQAGAVTDCRIIESSGHTALDHKTCAVLGKRVVFTPARNASGEATVSYYLAPNVRWFLEDW